MAWMDKVVLRLRLAGYGISLGLGLYIGEAWWAKAFWVGAFLVLAEVAVSLIKVFVLWPIFKKNHTIQLPVKPDSK